MAKRKQAKAVYQVFGLNTLKSLIEPTTIERAHKVRVCTDDGSLWIDLYYDEAKQRFCIRASGQMILGLETANALEVKVVH